MAQKPGTGLGASLSNALLLEEERARCLANLARSLLEKLEHPSRAIEEAVMNGRNSNGSPDMVCGGRNVDPRPVEFGGERQEVKPPEAQIINISELFKYNEDVSDFARSFTKKVD